MSNEKSKKEKGPRWNTGPVAVNVYSNLLRDFRASEGSNFFAGTDVKLSRDIAEFRSISERELGDIPVGRFKRTKQMEALLKKFRFSTDAYTDDELSERTQQKFLEEQIRLHAPMALKLSGFKLLQRARLIAHRLLGEYSGAGVVDILRF